MNTISLPASLTWLQNLDFQYKLGICERIFSKKLATKGICWTQTGAGIPWKLDLNNPTHRWIVYGKYEEPLFINWAKKFLPTNGIVVDSGANIGQMLMYLAQYIPKGKVLAFEPGTEAANWLEECLLVNSNLPVEVIRAGLGASVDRVRLNHIGENGGFGHGAWSQISQTEGEAIRIVRLADELTSRSITTVDLWKLDVEGYEIPALQGAEEFLKRQRIKAIYAELHGENGKRVRDYLAKFGYHCHLITPQGKPYKISQLPDRCNGLFLLQ
ncbi:MAG: FkbM family methyltransferase [Mastigocoleus sp.]